MTGVAPSFTPALRTPPQGAGAVRRLRSRVGATLEYAWELSGSVRLGRVDAVLVEGTEPDTGDTVRTFYLGHYDNYAFVLGRLFSDFRVVEKHEGVHSLRARHWIARYAADASLVAIDLELLYCKMLPTQRYLAIPQWIRQKYTMPETWDAVLASFRKNTKRVDLRRVRKYGFTSRLTDCEADFQSFYHDMYVPYLTRRFEDEVIIEPEAKVLRQCRKGTLMHILRDEQVVAAVLLHLQDGRLAYVWVGVPADLDDELFTGAFSAMYYFTLRHGFESGCHEVDFLGSRPLLNDGLFRYKRKWGTYVEDSPVPRGDILLQPLRFDAPIRAAFRRNPFIVRDGAALAGKLLLGDEPARAEDLADLVGQYATPGIARLKCCAPAGFADDAHAWAQKSDTPVQLVDLSNATDAADAFCRA